MTKTWGVVFLTCSLLLGSCKRSVTETSTAQKKLNQVALLLDSNSIASLSIAYGQCGGESPFPITTDALRKGPSVKLEINYGALQRYSGDLARSIRESEALPAEWTGDVCTAVTLYQQGGKEVLRVSYDKTGRNGYVDSDAVQLSGALRRWSDSMVPR